MSQPLRIVPPMTITDATLITSNVPETDHAEWLVGTAYTTGQRVIRLTTHKIYEALRNNTDKTPESSPLGWIEVAPTNRWRAFSGRSLSQTVNAGEINYTIRPGRVVNAVGLVNVEAQSVTVRMTDPVDGMVYERTRPMVGTIAAADYYEYCFGETVRVTDALFSDLPAYGTADIEIEIDNGSNDAKCGPVVIGAVRNIGLGVLAGASVGIQDYSRREVNEFGEASFIQRGYAKRANFDMLIRAGEVDSIQRLFADIRATPALFVGSGIYSATAVFGWYKDFSILIAYRDYSECSIEVEAIT